MNKLLIITILFTAFSPALFAEQLKPTAVVGFVNLGDAKDDSLNGTMARSLTAFLQKIPKSKIVPFADVEKAAQGKGFYKLKSAAADVAISVAQGFDIKQVVFGDYKVDPKSETVEVNVLLVDVVTGDVKFKKNYKGKAGVDIFDTVDTIIRNVSGLLVGREISTARLKITVPTDRKYKVYLNGRFEKEITKNDSYSDVVFANEETEVSLRFSDSGKEVLRQTVKPLKNEKKEIKYTPSGDFIVKLLAGSGRVFLNNNDAGPVDEHNDLIIPNIKAGESQLVRVESDGKTVGEKTARVNEGASEVVVMGADGKRSFFFYVRGLEGGLGGSLGIGWSPWQNSYLNLLGGAVVVKSTVIPTVNLEAGYTFYKLDMLQFKATASCLAFIYNPAIISPALKIGVDIYFVTVEAGVRYSFYGSYAGFYPIVSVGVKF